MLVTNLKCDICGFSAPISPNVTGWYVGTVMTVQDMVQVGPLTDNELEHVPAGVKHICGLQCVHKFVDSVFNVPQTQAVVEPLHKSLDQIEGIV